MSMADKKREPIAVWWEISKYMATILPVDVVDFTEATVVCLEGTYRPRERRHRRENIFPSFAEAKAEAVSRATQQHFDRGVILISWINESKATRLSFANWAAAAEFTRERMNEVADLDTEISLLRGWRHVQEGNFAANQTLKARLEARADLTRGMKGMA